MTTLLTWMSDSLEGFRGELALTSSANTLMGYCGDVLQFLTFAKDKGVKRMTTLKRDHITSFLGYLKTEGKSYATIHRSYMALRSYCNYLKRKKCLTDDIMFDVKIPLNKQHKAPRIPSVEQVEQLLLQPDLSKESGVRDRAILELLYSSGLRATELTSLEMHHIAPTSVIVSCGKRGKTRTVPLTEEAVNWIKRYVELRGDEPGYLFLTDLRRQMTRQALNKLVVKYAKHASLSEITTHTLRHACATHLLDAGADLRLIQEVLGHSSISSTQRYTHLSSNKIQSMFQKFHPRKTEVLNGDI